MSTLKVTVEKIDEIKRHENADKLELAIIKGWTCVIKKDTFKAGDKIVYFPIDSILPGPLATALNVCAYLSNGRVRAAKLRNIPSYGLVVDIPTINEFLNKDILKEYGRCCGSWGDDETYEIDLTNDLGVTKWEPPLPQNLGADTPIELFTKYTDIENMRNYPNVIVEGEEVRITEKCHGCLKYDTRITMADGTKKSIHKIVTNKLIGDYVLGMDNDGNIVPTKITNIFDNGKELTRWFKIIGERRCAGKGNSFFAISCTDNHQFFIDNKYVCASDLKIGDEVSNHRTDLGLNLIQKQVLLGKMLGDGYFHDSKYSAALIFGHKKEHIDYVLWTLKGLGEISSKKLVTAKSGYGTEMIRASTIYTYFIKEYLQSFIKNKKKIIPEWIIKDISPISLAFWYMDDGSLSRHVDQEDRANFATCGFTEKDSLVLDKIFLKFNIKPTKYFSENYLRYRLNADEAEKFFLLIAPYIPPIMQYKLPERYRGGTGWLPSNKSRYKTTIIKQKITNIIKIKENHKKYDIETETHNYFANGVLVHNSNSRFGYVEREFMTGSHNMRLRMDYINNWTNTFDDNLKNLVKTVSEREDNANVIVYAEIFGWVQDLHYGLPQGKTTYRVFDIKINEKYIDYDKLISLCTEFNIKTVPILYVGPFSKEIIQKYSDGNSVVEGADNMMEGCVVTPLVERYYHKVGRVILKYVFDRYLCRKNGTENH